MRAPAIHLVAVSLIGLSGCLPPMPPAREPALVVAAGPLRTLPSAQAGAGSLLLVLRAGSAYDPPGREGLALVLAHAVAARAGVSADVEAELVRFHIPEGRAAAFAVSLVDAVDEAAMAVGRAAARPGTGCAALARDGARAWGLAGHPYGHRAEGRSSVLSTLTAGEAQAFRQLRYVRDAAVLVVGPGADATPLLQVLPPTLSRSVTPAVKVAAGRERMTVAGAVSVACEAWVVGSPEDWGASDEAALAVVARIAGDPLPHRRVDSAWVLSALPDAEALSAGLAWARAEVLAELAAQPGALHAADVLLGPLRGGRYSPAPALADALRALDAETLVLWADSLRTTAPRLRLIPESAVIGLESGVEPRVHSVEELLR